MATPHKQFSEPAFEGAPEEFIEILKTRIQGFIPTPSASHVKVVKFHGKSQKAEIKIENLIEFIGEKSIGDIKSAISESVLCVDIVNARQDISMMGVIEMMGRGAGPLAKAGIIDVLTGNIDECPEGSLIEPIDIRKTRLSKAFTGILGGGTIIRIGEVSGVKKMGENKVREDIQKLIAELVTPRFDKVDNELSEIKRDIKQLLQLQSPKPPGS